MSVEPVCFQQRNRFLVVHDDCVALDQRGPFRSICLALTERGADVHVIQSDGHDAALDLARDAADCAGYDAVLVAGGERTFSGVAAGLAHTTMPVGLLPVGPGDATARALGMQGKPHEVAALLCEAPDALFPGLMLNNLPVRQIAAFGRDANVLSRLTQHLRPGVAKPASSLKLAKNFTRPVERFDAVLDGMNYRCCCLFVMRTDGFARISGATDAKKDLSGPVTAVVIDADDRTALFDVLFLAKIGRLFQTRSVNVRNCRHVEIPGGQNLAIELDGEPLDLSGGYTGAFTMVPDHQPLSVICVPGVAALLGQTTRADSVVAA